MGGSFSKTLLIVDDDRFFCDLVRAYFAGRDLRVLSAHTKEEGGRLARDERIDVVLLDQHLPDGDGVDLCLPLLAVNDHAKIIFITAYPSFDNVLQALRRGANDYLAKPIEIEELGLIVEKVLRTQELERVERIQTFKNLQESRENVLIGAEGGLREVAQLVRLSAAHDASVLITGETGTGKNVVARAIHSLREKNNIPFVGINCAALPENLIESELFGHEKGAFTGAVAAKKGIFEMADGGTLFLDEIGDLPLHLQAKLLGILDDKQLLRVGGQTTRKVDVRIIAATNLDIRQAIREKRFREDLYYRLALMKIHIPPLRERKEDIAALCRMFLRTISQDVALCIDDEEIGRLAGYDWPGNVRELKNVTERAVILRRGPAIQPSQFLELPETPRLGGPSVGGTVVKSLAEAEKEHILGILQHCQGNHSKTALLLGISRSTLLRKLSQFAEAAM
ncbi:MAG: sigma-54 dependent transcriptional regulator [Desulfoprunum sp.]|nr:sigma-54 dependent transcriptional regulator [Desulfoprunum sp.]